MVRKPRALAPGDTLGLVAPSGGVQEPDRVDRAVACLEGLGFRVKTAPGCRSAWGYLAGKDALRAAEEVFRRLGAQSELDSAVMALTGIASGMEQALPLAERLLDVADGTHHGLELARLQAGAVIWARQSTWEPAKMSRKAKAHASRTRPGATLDWAGPV